MKFNARFINVISLTFSVFLVCLLSFGLNNIQKNFNSQNDKMLENIEKKEYSNTISNVDYLAQNDEENNEKVDKKIESDSNEEFDWYIEIPKINVYAPIEEGTNEEVLNRSIGHFENTSRRNGNCGLAAHNRGYRVNYFARLKEIEKGDLIYYFVDGKKYKYEVCEILIIYETDWSMLEDTEDNKITLITCVENREEYRLCVQGCLVQE